MNYIKLLISHKISGNMSSVFAIYFVSNSTRLYDCMSYRDLATDYLDINDMIIIECNIVNGWQSSFLINLTKVFNYIYGITSSLYVVIKKYINLIYPALTN